MGAEDRGDDEGAGQVPGQGWPPFEESLAAGRSGVRLPGQAAAGFGGVTPDAAAPDAGSAAATGAVPSPADPVDTQRPPSDAELTARVRWGDDGAVEELYRRHAESVRRYARTCCRDSFTAEDLTGEVFARTLQALKAGKGPELAVRAYLLTAVRNVAAAWARTERREHLVEDFTVFAAVSPAVAAPDAGDPGADAWAMARADRRMVVRAFAALPEADRVVLWHTEVEQEPPGDVAVLLGKTANATAVQAHRARDRLAAAFLQAHVAAAQDDGCAGHAGRLGAYARGGLRRRASAEVGEHLRRCDRCSAAYLELRELNSGLRAVLPSGVLVWLGPGHAVTGAAAAVVAGGGAAGRRVAEGAGTAARAGFAATVAAAVAGAVLAYALAGGSPAGPVRLAGRPPAPSASPTTVPATPRLPVVRPSDPASLPAREPARAPVGPVHRPSAARTPTVPPAHPATPATPEAPPVPAAAPGPTPPAAPPQDGYWLDDLVFAGFGWGEDGGPVLRDPAGGLLWPRTAPWIGGTEYRRGATVRVPAAVTVDLGGRCSSFDTVVGVDDLTQGLGEVVFSVLGGDGRPLWRSPVLRGGDSGVRVSVPLSGERSVRLVVRAGAEGGWWRADAADWADARFRCGLP